ncbi:MAG: hypothetical protein V5A55_03470 [Halovenus sp.]
MLSRRNDDSAGTDEPVAGAGDGAEDGEFLAGSLPILLFVLALLHGAALFTAIRHVQD